MYSREHSADCPSLSFWIFRLNASRPSDEGPVLHPPQPSVGVRSLAGDESAGDNRPGSQGIQDERAAQQATKRALLWGALCVLVLAITFGSRAELYNVVYGPFEIHRLELVEAQSLDDLGLRRWFRLRGDGAFHSGWKKVIRHGAGQMGSGLNYYLVTFGRRILVIETTRVVEDPSSAEFEGYLRPIPDDVRKLVDNDLPTEEVEFRLPFMLYEDVPSTGWVLTQLLVALALALLCALRAFRNARTALYPPQASADPAEEFVIRLTDRR